MGICVTVPRDISCYSNVWYRDTPSKSTKVSVDSFNACWKHLVRIHQYPNNEIVHAKYIGFLFFKLHLEIMTFNNCLRQIEIRFTSAAGIVFINLSNFFFLSIFFFFFDLVNEKNNNNKTPHTFAVIVNFEVKNEMHFDTVEYVYQYICSLLVHIQQWTCG